MTKKIFLAVFLTAFISSFAAVMAYVLVDGCDTRPLTFAMGIVKLIPIFAVVLGGISYLAARNIVKPVKRIDPEHPDAKKAPKELAPVLKRLKLQNGRVNRQRSELSDSRERFSLITESMKEGIIIADSKTSVLSCNSSAYKLLGAEPPETGQSIYSLSNAEPFRRCIQDAMGGRQSECILKTERGDRKVMASPAAVSDVLNGIVVFVLDVTEEQALEKMRREFTSNVSHELKTPLTTIYGIADMLANGMVKTQDVAEFGGNIRTEAERLINLINDIVSLSKLDENDLPRQDEEVDLYDLAAEVIERLKNAAEAKGVMPALIGDHVKITGSRTILSEVLYNLCDNAIKYNTEGGSYTVRVSHIPMKAIVTVTDTGIGIPQEHIERIFERFYRVDKSRSRKIEGTGLGLSIVKHGVSYHNGTVRAANVEKGSVFVVELPVV